MNHNQTNETDFESADSIFNAYAAAAMAPIGHVTFLWLNPYAAEAGWMCFECEDHEPDEYESNGYYWPGPDDAIKPALAAGILNRLFSDTAPTTSD